MYFLKKNILLYSGAWFTQTGEVYTIMSTKILNLMTLKAGLPVLMRDHISHVRAVSISYETNVTFPNSPYLDKFTVMG